MYHLLLAATTRFNMQLAFLSARSSSFMPYIMPWARWQRKPRADGLSPRSDQQGSWVMHAALRGPAGSREAINRGHDALGICPHAKAAQPRTPSHGRDERAAVGLVGCPGQRRHESL